MAVSKVVRVEDVLEEPLDTPATPLQLLNDGDAETVKAGADISRGSTGGDTGEEGDAVEQQRPGTEGNIGDSGDAASEENDKVYPLPENWPKIKELKRPMSCALSNSRLPCVRKAVSHLELIQNIIDEWFRRTVEEMKSRTSTAQSSRSLQVPVSRKQLRFKDPSRSTTQTGQSSQSALTSRASSASVLSIAGLGAYDDEISEEAGAKEEEETGLEIPYLGAEDVIEETITLLARLELDRQEAQANYVKEMEVVAMLKHKTNTLRLRRLREMPALVQKEHEACTVDLNELNWHVAYVTRAEAKAQSRKDIADALNKRLKEEIAYIKQHIPLVQEKLVLELAAMDRIKKAQVETNQELMTTKQRQAKTEQKSTEAMTKAETERGHIKRELDIVRDSLSHISEELSTAKMTFNSYVHQVNDMTQQLTDNAQELHVLEVKMANAKAAEELQATKVRALQNKIAEAEFEFQRLQAENDEAEEELRALKAKNAAKLADLSNKFKALEAKLLAVTRKNQELTIVIEDTQDKIRKCDEQRIADEKNLRRIERELERVTTMFQATSEEHLRVSQINHHIRDQLQAEQEKAFRLEESLKNMAENLRRQVKEEVHTRTVLQARINSDTAEIEKTRVESAKKKEKADKVSTDVNAAVDVVLEKVEKLRAQKAAKDKEIEDLQRQLRQLREKHTEATDQFRKQIDEITPHFKQLKEELAQIQDMITQLFYEIEVIEEKRRKIAEDMYTQKCKLNAEMAAELEKMRKKRLERLKRFGSEDADEESGEKKKKKKIVHISSSDNDIRPRIPPGRAGFEDRGNVSDSDLHAKPTGEMRKRSSGYLRLMQRLRDEVSKLDKQLEHMAWKTDLMTKKIQEMDSAQIMMDKVYKKTDQAIKELTAELSELQIQLETTRKLGEQLRQEHNAVVDRIKDGESGHSRYMAERTAVLHKQEADKLQNLAKNKELAARYRQLQNEFLIMKEKLLRSFDERLKLESTISDIKQLKSLQSKMHGALAEYFKLSGLYNEGELVRLEQASSANGVRVGQLQVDMEQALSLITNFLQTEMDGTKARQMAWEAVRKMGDEKGTGGEGLGQRQASSAVTAS